MGSQSTILKCKKTEWWKWDGDNQQDYPTWYDHFLLWYSSYMGKNIYIPGRKFLLLLSTGDLFVCPLLRIESHNRSFEGNPKAIQSTCISKTTSTAILLPILSWPVLEKARWQGTHYLSGNSILGQLWLIGNLYWDQNLSLWFFLCGGWLPFSNICKTKFLYFYDVYVLGVQLQQATQDWLV